MRGILPTVVDTKYNIILSQERRLAKAVASRVVKTPDLTVWAVMIPFIFLFNFLRYKRASETFALNLLFTKRLALDAARDILNQGQSRQEVLAQIEDRTSDILATDKEGVYSDKIRRKQMDEISLLLDHYLKLLDAKGDNYESLVKNAYPTQDDYKAFLHELTRAEWAVNRAAIQALGKTETAYEVISEIEKTTEGIRTGQVEKIFS